MAEVLSRLKGADGATMPRLGTASRLAVIGGFVLLGWLALAVASATKAAADPASPHSRTPSTAAADAGSAQSLLDELPVVRTVVHPLDSTLVPVIAPATPAVRSVVAPVRPAVRSLTQALEPVTTPVEHAVAGVTGRLDPIVRPLAKVARDVVGEPSREPSESMRATPTRAPRSLPKSHRVSAGGSPYSVREISIPRPAVTPSMPSRARTSQARPAGSARSATARTDLPTTPIYGGPLPRPGPPPDGPALLGALTAGSVASSRGAPAGGLSGCPAGDGWAAPDVRPAGPIAWDRSRAVRNSAAKPSVSPD